jgi:hypothetical protein
MASSLVAFAVITAAAVTGCMTPITASSRSYLGPAQSGAVTAYAVDKTALEVTRLFEARGFAMVDQHIDTPDGERLLKYSKRNRALAAEREDGELVGPNDVGSVFYAWVTPSGTGSTVSVLGKPTLAGVEPCTDDGVVLPCAPLHADSVFANAYLSGHTEAEIAHGVLSELALEGYATGPMPASALPPTGDPAVVACRTRRHQQLLQVLAEHDPDARAKLLERVPSC